jgi:catechol 2,3-dioxygenase-like lactoylglutathione lyase family enzyme
VGISLTKDSIDLGIVVKDADAALRFYRDTVGLIEEGTVPMPGGGTMYRLRCGTSMIKVIAPGAEPPASSPPGGIGGAYGYRYWTMLVSNVEEMADVCSAAGYEVVWPPREFRPGVMVAMVEDPDGNWVEFVRYD